ncbi:hypothetical protein [Nonomuraea roseoviolacea]|uniref:WD40 repeat domain-containing protein n=1 Tax=Nonomuraea roseoviolacea subsp. carminata TaxID=160689 RepID=A0ABT1K927_9ACTN|nr:hypothetical protein [Nonomuraea roseoviolacea]MCP2350455.1 hypothetical protein [Nonomuraea roseoviolacea subsp. carminata]
MSDANGRGTFPAGAAAGAALGLAVLLATPATALAAPVAAPMAGPMTAPMTAPVSVLHEPPHAHTGHGQDSVRYVSIKGCPSKGGETRPCGAWRVVMHSGARGTLPDAQTIARDAKGRKAANVAAPVAVSGNGRRLAYFTKGGRLALRTLGGGVSLLPGNALPKVAQYETALQLSDDGSRLAVSFTGDKARDTRVFDTGTGERIGTIPAAYELKGFSADGGEVLAGSEDDEGSQILVAYSDSGQELARVTPPQVIASNGPQALSGDGRTVAALAAKRRLALYDMATDQVTARLKVKLPAGDVEMVDWTGPSQVTVHLVDYKAKGYTVSIAQIDTGTGKVTIRDRYALLKDTFVFAACGG